MKAKTTPGPWRADVVDCTVYSATDGVRVAVVAGDGTNADANARLIAAAPELREALRAFLAAFDCACPTCKQARAALAKADGKEG